MCIATKVLPKLNSLPLYVDEFDLLVNISNIKKVVNVF
jgi:hypothetical protein